MNRISVERVVAAYEKSGIVPEDGVWYLGGVNCGCALSACMFADGHISKEDWRYPTNPHAWISVITEKLGLTKDYVVGFMWGFDDVFACDLNTDRRIGFNDGEAARKVVLKGEKDNS